MKKSFILYSDQFEPIKSLSREQMGELLYNIFQYQLGKELVFKDPIVKMAFLFFKQTFERDNIKYKNICERNRINGLKGGRPKNPGNPLGSLGTQVNPSKPKKADSDSDNESDSVKKKKKKKKKSQLYPVSFKTDISEKEWLEQYGEQ